MSRPPGNTCPGTGNSIALTCSRSPGRNSSLLGARWRRTRRGCRCCGAKPPWRLDCRREVERDPRREENRQPQDAAVALGRERVGEVRQRPPPPQRAAGPAAPLGKICRNIRHCRRASRLQRALLGGLIAQPCIRGYAQSARLPSPPGWSRGVGARGMRRYKQVLMTTQEVSKNATPGAGPSLTAIFLAFLRLGGTSFGGGTAGWLHREDRKSTRLN